MARITIKIPHVVWRAGRPRFVPAAGARALGFRGRDLRHPDGTWFTLDQTVAAARMIDAEIRAARAAAKAAGKPRRPARAQPAPAPARTGRTVGDLLTEYIRPDRPRLKPVRPSTLASYRKIHGIIATRLPAIWAMLADDLTRPRLYAALEDIAADTGAATRAAIVAAVSAAWSWAVNRGLAASNPFLRMGVERAAGRLRVGSRAEIRQLIRAADLSGRPDVADMILLGVMTGQRQGDRIALAFSATRPGWIVLRQAKTSTTVELPAHIAAELCRRLEAATDRRKAWRVAYPQACVNETLACPWTGEAYRHAYARVRAIAAGGIPAEGFHAGPVDGQVNTRPADPENPAHWLLPPLPSVADFRDQDTRDTTVTWLADRGATMAQICAITGHSPKSATMIMQSYLSATSAQASAAMSLLEEHWGDSHGS